MKDILLESPTRFLSMNAPKGVHIKALPGNLEAVSNQDILLHTSEGMLLLNSESVRLSKLPEGQMGGGTQELYEVCACPSGKLYISRAGMMSTCHQNQDC
ncbi:hypothetical protein AAFF_G00397270 [Aldrovandia affinis]|uniref:Gamma-sarcoglycan n=1 Tax=Aldrovandia affinis TaxID=143900 RepID=A0AAD7SD21_9TELE|nr:hypothetical protein AAFF_G00397270 [Aldrovandia affinis]